MRVRDLVAVCGLLLVACGSLPSGFGDGGTDAGDFDSTTPPKDSGNPFGDVGAGEAAPPCQGLQCQVVSCGGNAHTTISGTVYDPAGAEPLYDVLVYIPTFANDPLPPITHGMSCDTCAAKIDNAMATALTDAKGKFTIQDAPVGQNIPIVVQVGKWRRKLTIATVAQCVDNAYPNPNTPAQRMRLPAKQSEGDMPLIALSTGCDPMESLFQKIGIDPSEFTAASGTGMVHVYGGNEAVFTVPNETSAYTFWDSLSEMEKYDIIINECECSPNPRGQGYQNLETYLNGGGRFFGSHYHINFFTGNTTSGTDAVPADMKAAVKWAPQFAGSCGSGPYAIDTTFPKGKAMADWLENLYPSIPYGTFTPTSSCIVPDMLGTVTGISQQWIYDTSSQAPAYVSFNTPTAKQPTDRCGRAVAADLHVGSGSGPLQQQEAALEFMFFDLAACVQDDNTTPQPPPVN
ncbi:MAG TPA: hypothetical protein VGH28_34345 [Polyangiaceae bacterium]|jgi:hypothetical protein